MGDGTDAAQPPSAATVEVRLLGLPLQHRARLSDHVEGLLRELALVRVGQEQSSWESLPARLLQLAVELDTTYAPYRAQRGAVMDEALAAGQEFFDAVYQAPAASVGWVRHLGEVLEEADGFCRDGVHLLTPPASPELVAFRRWLFGEIVQQLSGKAPSPWPGSHGRAQRTGAAGEPGRAARATATELTGVLGSSSTPAAGVGGGGRVVGEPLVMESMASAVSRARRYVRQALTELGAPELEESAELAVSELVTNAMLHARTAFTVTVRALEAGGVRVEVADTSPLPVVVRRHGLSAATGRGLQLVAAVSAAWGIEAFPASAGTGKCVWFEPRADPGDEQDLTQRWAEDLAGLLQPSGPDPGHSRVSAAGSAPTRPTAPAPTSRTS
ncbi:ATP-binding protein [Kineococcus rhizosphaerae]|uniref:Histidine kinase/HSP90-like ATPase domain-containing protein n=1 Tax=Kineococcus rhizosphaerae TaxID=559628 RepID=A0A2T0QXT8_9ACTN|nr:ATP-binding protein [Kineococcus rhizosphaerae]PRY10764.1 hypothetical protein CLV37_11528 [Kineococcus rhizosphaerae]